MPDAVERSIEKQLRKIINDNKVFDEMFKPLLNFEHSIHPEKFEEYANSKTRSELRNSLLITKKMVDDHTNLFHLLNKAHIAEADSEAQMEKWKKLDKVIEELLEFYKDLLEKVGALQSRFFEVQDKYFLDGEAKIYDIAARTQITRLKRILKMARLDSDELKEKIANVYSGTKLFEVKRGFLRVEVRELIKAEQRKTGTRWGVFVFHHNFYVAEVLLAKYKSKKMYVLSAGVGIKGRGYVQRAIEMLLADKRGYVTDWYSDTHFRRSDDANAMYLRLEQNPKLLVDKENQDEYGRWHVRLRNK